MLTVYGTTSLVTILEDETLNNLLETRMFVTDDVGHIRPHECDNVV